MVTRSTKIVSLIVFAGVFALLGCGGGGIGSKTNFRVMNAVPDQTSITTLLDGTAIASSIAYGSDGGYTETKSGSRHLQVEPAASTTVFLDQTLNLSGGTNTTAIISNTSSNSSAIVLTDDNTAPTTGNIKLRIVHAAPAFGSDAVDVYVVAPNTSLANATPAVTNLGLGSSSAYLTLPAGSFDIAFTPHGSTFSFFFTGPITFTPGQNRTIVVLNSLSGGFSIGTLKDLN